MNVHEVCINVFFISLGIIFYTYMGYGLLATIIGFFRKKQSFNHVAVFNIKTTVIIPAYNEAGVINEKITNTLLALANFKHAQVILITDGSNDGSSAMCFNDKRIVHINGGERKGKSAAINKSMEIATGDIVIITDANAMVNLSAFEKLAARFDKEKTGAVSGEKKVLALDGSTGGEGIYWKYESFLKQKSALMYSLTGAAGELLAFRKSLFIPIPSDAILDDMVLSLNIIKQGKVIDYEPMAFAIEPPSKTIADEFKRKVRISAGVFQTLTRNFFVFNPFKNSLFVFQFLSHRILRWTISILCIALIFITNLFLLKDCNLKINNVFFKLFFTLQCLFYLFAILGFVLRNHQKIPSFLFLPFYFTMMNVAVLVGFFRFCAGKETVLWKKAAR